MRVALAIVAAWNGLLSVSALPVIMRGGFHGLPFALWTLSCAVVSAWAALSHERAGRYAARLLVFSAFVAIPWLVGFGGVSGAGCGKMEWLSLGVLCGGSLALSAVIPVALFITGIVMACRAQQAAAGDANERTRAAKRPERREMSGEKRD